MLEVITMTFCDLSIHSLLDPSYFINKFVAEILHHFESETIFCVDDPDEEEAILLNLVKWNVQDLLIVQSVICNGYSSGRVG